jgi:hypothetical protein
MKMQSDLARTFLVKGYSTETAGADLISHDKREVYEIKMSGRGVRDLRNAAVGLATYLPAHVKTRRGYVLASLNRISAGRVRTEWDRMQQVLLPDIRARMNLVAVVDGIEIVELPRPQRTPIVDRFLETAVKKSRRDSQSSATRPSKVTHPLGTSWKHLEIEKVLLHRWLLGEGAIPVGTLCRQVGCSYPTAIQAIGRLSAVGELIERGRGRSVALAKYPRDRWAELLRAQRLTYPPDEFVNPIAEPGAIDGIMRRLNRLKLKGAAIGGVIAARRWDPSFDLNGTPRIDVVLHMAGGRAPSEDDRVGNATEFVRRIDPALARRSPRAHGATVLVLHSIYRADPLFLEEPQSPMPWADPVEVLCHLNDLGLTAQAAQLIQRIRQDVNQ